MPPAFQVAWGIVDRPGELPGENTPPESSVIAANVPEPFNIALSTETAPGSVPLLTSVPALTCVPPDQLLAALVMTTVPARSC